jgi:hypothetical protein
MPNTEIYCGSTRNGDMAHIKAASYQDPAQRGSTPQLGGHLNPVGKGHSLSDQAGPSLGQNVSMAPNFSEHRKKTAEEEVNSR